MAGFQFPIQVAVGVFRVPLGWTQLYILVEGREFSLVDSGTRSDRAAVLGALRRLNLNSRCCRQILLTHAHCDHAGNAAFFAARGAQVCCHVEERPFIETMRLYGPRGRRLLTPPGFAQAAMFALGEVLYPVRRVTVARSLHDGDTVQTPAGAWRAVHTPGHTRGHVAFFRERDGVLLSGDALLNVVPFLRREALAVPPWIFNWDTPRARQSARRLGALSPRLLLSGHGRPLDDATDAIARFVARLPA